MLDQAIDRAFDVAIPFEDVAEPVFANVRFESDPAAWPRVMAAL